MSRYTGEARITFNGDRALAARYVSEGRKYLGGLMATSPVETAVRELTNPDGVHFRVGYFGGVPFIEITAGKAGEPRYMLAVNRGYAIAPRGVTYTSYSSNPAVIVNPFKGIDELWSSAFFDDPAPLSGATHPTSTYADSYKVYESYFASLSSEVYNNDVAFSSPRMMSWNDKSESLWLHWFGSGHGRTTHQGYAWLYHNGKLVADLNALTSDTAMLMGVAAKRTSGGLTVYATVLEQVNFNLKFLKLYSIKLVPTTVEKKRLDALKAPLSYGYASVYDADTVSFAELASYQIDGIARYMSSFPHNQSATEARGFVGIGAGDTISMLEFIVDYSVPSSAVITASVSQTLTDTTTETKTIGTTLFNGAVVKHIRSLSDPDAATRAPGVYTYTEMTAPAKQERWTNKLMGMVPASYVYERRVHLSEPKIKCLVDYAEDKPVYAYLHVSDTIKNIDASLTFSISVSEPMGSLTVEVFDTFPVTTSSRFTASVSWTYSRSAIYAETSQSRNVGISAPLYDVNGYEIGDWLNETELSSAYWDRSGGEAVNEIAVNIDSTGSSILDKHEYVPGTGDTRAPLISATGADNRGLNIAYLNLRTRSAYYEKTRNTSENINTVTAGTITYITSYQTGPYYGSIPWIYNLNRPFTTTVHSESSDTIKTVFKHAGGVIFDSGWVNKSAPTSSDTTSVQTLPALGFYTVAAGFVNWINTATVAAVNAAAEHWNMSAPQSPSPFPISAVRPDPDVNTASTEQPSFSIPSSGSYMLRSGQPTYAVGIATTLGTFVANVNYSSGISGAKAGYVATNNTVGSLDYMLGAHSAPWFTAPFLISAIAVNNIKL